MPLSQFISFMNRISIITVNRNNSEGLKKTILSVIGQTYTNYEFIVIDGASSDQSVDIITQYQSNISYWVSEPDAGIFNAMNKGIQQASGDYLYFLNSADAFADNDVLNKIFGRETYTAPFINGHQLNDFGNYTQRVPAMNRPLTLFDFYWGTIKHQATFIHKSMFAKYGMYDENLKITADWKFFLQTIGLHNEQPLFTDTDIVLFQWDGISTNPQLQKKHEEERLTVLNECIPHSIQKDYERFHYLADYEYLLPVFKKSKLFSFLVRALVKIFK